MLKQKTSSAWVFDLESDGLLDEATKIHTICIGRGNDVVDYGPDDHFILDALHGLQEAEVICGHNIIGFDIPLIQKLHPWWKPKGLVLDTLVLARLAYNHIQQIDWMRQKAGMPKNLYGAHKLEAWGYRLGIYKGDFGKTTDWAQWTPEMAEYCKQDVLVTQALLDHLAETDVSWDAVVMEHRLQEMICAQERHGFDFDLAGAQALVAEISEKRDALLVTLQEAFPPVPAKCIGVYGNQKNRAVRILQGNGIAQKLSDSSESYCFRNREFLKQHGIKFKWSKEIPFNPNSEKQIIERLLPMGWEPLEFTETGQPKMDESILEQVGKQFPEAAPIAEFAMLEKRLGQIAVGNNAWLKLVGDDGRIHGRCNTMGTVTHRFTHSNPNMGQVPGVRKPYGTECRSLFYVPEGYALVGCDVSGLELRILAHYMAKHDGGAYGRTIVEGDIHVANQEAAGLSDRDQAKTFIYAFLYGAGDAKLGSIAHPEESNQEKLRRAGKALRARFMRRTPALARFAKGVREKAGKLKKLTALDGREIHCRSPHSALNALIQCGGSIATKRATVHFWDLMTQAGHIMERDWWLVAHVHDEWQTKVRREIADETARIAVRAIEETGDILGLRCPITGKASIGRSWAETH